MQFQKGSPEPLPKPMALSAIEGVDTSLHSPRDGNRNGIPEPLDINSDEYRKELNEVTLARLDVVAGKWPYRYFEFCDINPEPAEFLMDAGITVKDPVAACNFVRMDAPDELMRAIITWLNKEMIPLRYEQPNCFDFLGRNVHAMTQYQLWASEVMEIIFESKYDAMQPRPEELVGESFPQYPCPPHPEDPTGHGGFAGCGNYTAKRLFKCDSQAGGEIEDGTKMITHLRDIAGMHLRTSSKNSWLVGNRELGPATQIDILPYFLRWA